MTPAAKQNPGLSRDQDVGQTSPILVVSIEDQRNFWIFRDVPQAFELLRRSSLGFFIDRREKFFAIKGKANGDNQRLAAGVGCGEMSDAGGSHQAQGARGQFNSSQSFQTSTLSPRASFPLPF